MAFNIQNVSFERLQEYNSEQLASKVCIESSVSFTWWSVTLLIGGRMCKEISIARIFGPSVC